MKVPALCQGLTILEECVKNKRIRFTEIKNLLSLTKASTARLLNQLVELGYLVKSPGEGYIPGPNLYQLFPYTPMPDRLYQKGTPLLRKVVDQTGNTCLLTYWNGCSIQVIAKESHPYSVVMQDIGSIREDILYYPWGWIFYAEMNKSAQELFISEIAESADWHQRLRDGLKLYKQHEFTYASPKARSCSHRFAAPVFHDNQVIGALGMGMPFGKIITRQQILKGGRQLAEVANDLSELLRK